MMLYCVSHSRLPNKDGDILPHPSNDGLFTAKSREVIAYLTGTAKNISSPHPRPRALPNHYFLEVGDFDAGYANQHDVFWTRAYSCLFKSKVGLLARLLTVRTEWSRK